MNILAIYMALLLVAIAATAPTSEIKKTLLTKELLVDNLVIYNSRYDIVQIIMPINKLNYGDDTELIGYIDVEDNVIFFVEAEDQGFFNYKYKGLFIYNRGRVTKLLANGRDVVAVNDDSDVVYFAATDGIYVYNAEENKAVKYGNLTDNIISIETKYDSDVLYIITDTGELFEVTNNGTKKTKVEEVEYAEKMVLDHSNNIYYYDDEKQPYIVNAEGIKKFNGLPENPLSVTLIKPPSILNDCVPFVVDDKIYYLHASGIVEHSGFEINDHPTAYAAESMAIQYIGYQKRLYATNVLGDIFDIHESSYDDILLNDKDYFLKYDFGPVISVMDI